jgi:hypothetical protein
MIPRYPAKIAALIVKRALKVPSDEPVETC